MFHSLMVLSALALINSASPLAQHNAVMRPVCPSKAVARRLVGRCHNRIRLSEVPLAISGSVGCQAMLVFQVESWARVPSAVPLALFQSRIVPSLLALTSI